MDKLPDELLELILEYVITDEVPFCMEDCLRGLMEARAEQAENDRLGLLPDMYIPELPLLLRRADIAQVDHLRDWQFVIGTCQRLRDIGKPMFFSRKSWAMTAQFADRIINDEVLHFSREEQRMAVHGIRSIIFMETYSSAYTSMLQLSLRLQGFPNLKRVDHVFGSQFQDTLDILVRQTRSRRKPSPQFIGPLRLLKVPVDDLDMGVIDGAIGLAAYNERILETCTYPHMRYRARRRARKDDAKRNQETSEMEVDE